jgi:hypothetical protein
MIANQNTEKISFSVTIRFFQLLNHNINRQNKPKPPTFKMPGPLRRLRESL